MTLATGTIKLFTCPLCKEDVRGKVTLDLALGAVKDGKVDTTATVKGVDVSHKCGTSKPTHHPMFDGRIARGGDVTINTSDPVWTPPTDAESDPAIRRGY